MSFSNISSSIPQGPWDVVVVGAGAAGLMTCLELPSQLKVLLLNRNTSRRSSSRWAQGGIAAAITQEDSIESHAQDTIKAGAGLCDEDAVRMFVNNAPKYVDRLEGLGMEFDKNKEDKFATTLEAAHSHRRVLHVKDRTGRELVEFLQDQVGNRPNIFHLRGIRVTQLWVENNHCCGVQVLDGNFLHWIYSRAVVLATGGGGHLFANTTNPPQASGEGVALAWQAGAIVEDLEFFQFHPTALKLDGAPCFLISEALRGEGALLVDKYGKSVVSGLEGAELAPRDQVSRELVSVMANQKVDHVGLDLGPLLPEKAENRFPTILAQCRELGLDPLKDFIPVAPAAHYWMGGVATDLNASTTVKGLYAVGEVACTGLHGANRLASNSLMECLVFAGQLRNIELNEKCQSNQLFKRTISVEHSLEFQGLLSSISLLSSLENLRKLCWREAGVNRSPTGMRSALKNTLCKLQALEEVSLMQFSRDQPKDICYKLDEETRRDLNLFIDYNNRLLVSSLLLRFCSFRQESRGGHYRIDYPSASSYWQCHTRQRKGFEISTRPVNN